MRHARARIVENVDIMLVTSPMTIAGENLVAGDFLISDGKRTYGMKHAEAMEKLKPAGKLGADMIDEAQKIVAKGKPKPADHGAAGA